MVTGNIKDAARYYGLHPLFKEAFEAYEKLVAEKAEPGTYEIKGKELYASVQSYKTKTVLEMKFETHRKYIDIQFVVSGEEYIPCTPISTLEECECYDEAEDISFYEDLPLHFTSAYLGEGDFAIFFPEDAHAPRTAVTNPAHVDKIVIKVAV